MSARFAKFVLIFCCAMLIAPLAAYGQAGGGGDGAGGGDGGDGAGDGGGQGGDSFFFSDGVVGGIKIDASGVLTGGHVRLDATVREKLESNLRNSDSNIKSKTKLRMISLRGLEQAITESREAGQPLSSEIKFMAGIQRIEYIIASPETNDIILAGPGEGYRLNDDGLVVGTTSGAPVIRLEDFLVAMRSVENARRGQGVSVSIDPTETGTKQLKQLYGYMKKNNIAFSAKMQPQVEKAMGPQTVRLTGVPQDSRFSQVLVAADYKMKRLSMGFEKANIEKFPSFMEIAQKAQAQRVSAAPRFWMECNYEPVAKTADNLVWQIRGKGVKALTQESRYSKDGERTVTTKQNRFAKQWADMMTERFEELADAEPVFRELRNVMDLSVVAAIITRERMTDKVGLETPSILGTSRVSVKTPRHAVAKVVPTQCSFVRIAKSWLVSASGGVQLDSWGVAANTETVAELADVGKTATKRTSATWWWNAN